MYLQLYRIIPEYYSKHPIFISLTESGIFSHSSNILCMSDSHSSLGSGLSSIDLVRFEAISILKKEKKWDDFLCCLDLLSVCHCKINSYCPEFGDKNIFAFLIRG